MFGGVWGYFVECSEVSVVSFFRAWRCPRLGVRVIVGVQGYFVCSGWMCQGRFSSVWRCLGLVFVSVVGVQD